MSTKSVCGQYLLIGKYIFQTSNHINCHPLNVTHAAAAIAHAAAVTITRTAAVTHVATITHVAAITRAVKCILKVVRSPHLDYLYLSITVLVHAINIVLVSIQ